jgi:hypothetical protein
MNNDHRKAPPLRPPRPVLSEWERAQNDLIMNQPVRSITGPAVVTTEPTRQPPPKPPRRG